MFFLQALILAEGDDRAKIHLSYVPRIILAKKQKGREWGITIKNKYFKFTDSDVQAKITKFNKDLKCLELKGASNLILTLKWNGISIESDLIED